jgi:hypothetical protein
MTLENPNQEHSEPKTSEVGPDKQSEVPKSTGSAEASRSDETSGRSKRDWHDHAMLWVQGVGVFFLIAYTTFAALQWCEMRDANGFSSRAITNAEEQFREESRPYIWFSVGGGLERPRNISGGKYDKHLAVPFQFTNYGKSPAIDVREDLHMAIGENAGNEIQWRNIPAKSGSMVPPGDTAHNAFISDGIVDDATLSKIVDGTTMLILYGHFEYTDMVSEPPVTYTSEFCFGGSGGASNPKVFDTRGYCKPHNRIK